MEAVILILLIILTAYFCFIKLIGTNNSKSTQHVAKSTHPDSEHKKLIGKPYNLQCKTDIFSEDELEILYKYGCWLSALSSGNIEPDTPKQNEFIKECQHFRKLTIKQMLSYFETKTDENIIQSTWFKYICRIKFERENPNILADEIVVDWGWQGPPINSNEDAFFSS